jgi:hypothetical protein
MGESLRPNRGNVARRSTQLPGVKPPRIYHASNVTRRQRKKEEVADYALEWAEANATRPAA